MIRAGHNMATMDVTVSGTVRSTPKDVYAFLSDFANWPRWQSDMKATELVDGEPGQLGARYHYISKAMGQTFDSTVRIVKADSPREVAFDGEWTGMLRPSGRYLVEPALDGALVTLNPHPEARGFGKVMAPLMGAMIRRYNRPAPRRSQTRAGRSLAALSDPHRWRAGSTRPGRD